jgi:hypothetical protein
MLQPQLKLSADRCDFSTGYSSPSKFGGKLSNGRSYCTTLHYNYKPADFPVKINHKWGQSHFLEICKDFCFFLGTPRSLGYAGKYRKHLESVWRVTELSGPLNKRELTTLPCLSLDLLYGKNNVYAAHIYAKKSAYLTIKFCAARKLYGKILRSFLYPSTSTNLDVF